MLSKLGSVFGVGKNVVKIKLTGRRWSGHRAMDIEPSSYGWREFKDKMHFWTLISTIPVIVTVTIINIRANPELTEIPEGYEPRHWEYYKHPITRFMAKHFFKPMELEHEMQMGAFEVASETTIVQRIQARVEKVMSFYNDHRSSYFRPSFAEYYRIGRDDRSYGESYARSFAGHNIDNAYDPEINPVPTEGYKPKDY